MMLSPYRLALVRAAPRQTPWWRWLGALTVPWEMRRRRRRLARVARLAEVRKLIDLTLRGEQAHGHVFEDKEQAWCALPCVSHELGGLLVELRALYLPRRRPVLARGTRSLVAPVAFRVPQPAGAQPSPGAGTGRIG